MSSIILFSSARRHGNTGRLADSVAAELNAELVDLEAMDIAPFAYDHANRHDDFEPLVARILDVDNLILASPVYWYSVTPTLKAFIDRLTDYLDLPELRPSGRRLRGKQCHVLCTSIHDSVDANFLGMLQQTATYLGMQFGGCLHVNCRRGFERGFSAVQLEKFLDQIRRPHGRRHHDHTNQQTTIQGD